MGIDPVDLTALQVGCVRVSAGGVSTLSGGDASSSRRLARREGSALWRVEKLSIIAIRSPKQYIFGLSALTAGIFSSLEISEPVKKWIDALPFVVGSDWLYVVIFTIVLGAFVALISKLLSSVWGVQPFEAVAEFVADSGSLPGIDDYVARRLREVADSSARPLPYRVQLVGEHDIELFNQLNREIFAFTAFALPLRVIRRRNNAIFRKNPSTAAIIYATGTDTVVPVGISHILPLNGLGASLYVKDHGLADEEITGRHVARQGEWSDAVVLFSMGLTRAGRGRMGRNIMADTFLDHLLVILSEMHAQNPGRTVASVYAQTERPTGAIGRLLARLNFKQTDMKTGDGFNLWEAEVQIPTLPVQR